MLRLGTWLALAILMASPRPGVDGYEPKRIRKVADLRDNMCPVMGHWPCVLLLNATGSAGCSTREPVWSHTAAMRGHGVRAVHRG